MNASEREAVKHRLNELHKKAGRITPDIVLADAEDDTSPLHGYFEWDDEVAGHAYRLDQARTLIRSVRVEIKTSTMTLRVPQYVRDPNVEHRHQGYQSTARLKSNSDDSRRAFTYEMDRAIASLRRCENLSHVFGLHGEFVRVLESAMQLRKKAETAKPKRRLPAAADTTRRG